MDTLCRPTGSLHTLKPFGASPMIWEFESVYPGRTEAPTDAGDATPASNMPRAAVRQARPRVQPRKPRALAGVHQRRSRTVVMPRGMDDASGVRVTVTSKPARAGAEASMPTTTFLLVTVCPPVEHALCVVQPACRTGGGRIRA